MPGLANKNTKYPAKFESQRKNEYFFWYRRVSTFTQDILMPDVQSGPIVKFVDDLGGVVQGRQVEPEKKLFRKSGGKLLNSCSRYRFDDCEPRRPTLGD